MSTSRVVIIAVGNASRGDDGVGPEFLHRLREHPVAENWWLTLVEDTEFQIEHALDLQINDLVVFVDASETAVPPFVFREVKPPPGHRILPISQALRPEDVVHTLSTISRRKTLPTCFVLELPASRFELSNALSEQAAASVHEALSFAGELLDNPDADSWRSRVGG